MNHKYDEILYCVAERTFESLAFILPTPRAGAGGGPSVTVSVRFSGLFSGMLFLTAWGRILPELATNMLGLEDDHAPPSPEKQNDALKELVNVICGNLLPEIAGNEAEFAIDAPETLADGASPRDCPQYVPAGRAQLHLDAGNAELALFTEETAVAKGTAQA